MTEKRAFNYGIALLKMIMCFEVVLTHTWVGPIAFYHIPLFRLTPLPVPVFMFLSFYFTAKIFSMVDAEKIRRRGWRLVYPQIGWTVIYWLAFVTLPLGIDYDISFTDVLWQLVTGHSPKLNISMWFQIVLIVLTFIFFVVFRYLKGIKGLLVMTALAVLSLLIQYTGVNIMLLDTLRYELQYPLGRIFEMMPYAVLGYAVAYFNVFEQMKKKRMLSLAMCALLFGVFYKLKLIPAAMGYGYTNNNVIVEVFFMVGLMYLLPLEELPEKVKQIIKFSTDYTLGIYCAHRLVAQLVNKGIDITGVKLEGLAYCLTIYITAFLLCYFMCKISSRYLKPLVE